MPQPRNDVSPAPIGVFDSGLGGLTVLRAIAERLPHEQLVYLGDSARVPYGTRSAQTVVNYARACVRKLREQDIKLLVVACNTVSAVALDLLSAELDFPVLGVIAPGAHAGVRASKSGRLGVIATAGTVLSGAYPRAAAAVSASVQVFTEAAPLLVPLVEEGWLEGDVPRLAVRKYLRRLVAHDIDALVLGCTHYPLLQPVIESELADLHGSAIPVVDSAHAVASELAEVLQAQQLAAAGTEPGGLRIFVTDMPSKFTEVASRFLGRDVASLDVTAIDL
jgi:glutamate racemase